jgi:predicted nucleic acid-binding protein
LHLSAISVAELRAGVALAPDGKRRAALHEKLETRVLPMFAGRMPPFDVVCAAAYAEILAKARAAGAPIGTADAFIAAIALANGFIVATRDVGPFRAAGLRVINPWDD